jgi:hypothetical protein
MEDSLPARSALQLASAAIISCLVLSAFSPAARAHGDAAWIMENPSYVTGTGSHCCGPNDCERVPNGAVVEKAPGKWLVKPTGQTFHQSDKGVYPSKRGSFWWCRRGAQVVCLFYEANIF